MGQPGQVNQASVGDGCVVNREHSKILQAAHAIVLHAIKLIEEV
jgi:hypothetical protein